MTRCGAWGTVLSLAFSGDGAGVGAANGIFVVWVVLYVLFVSVTFVYVLFLIVVFVGTLSTVVLRLFIVLFVLLKFLTTNSLRMISVAFVVILTLRGGVMWTGQLTVGEQSQIDSCVINTCSCSHICCFISYYLFRTSIFLTYFVSRLMRAMGAGLSNVK